MNDYIQLCNPVDVGKRIQIAQINSGLSAVQWCELLGISRPKWTDYRLGNAAILRIDKAIIISAYGKMSLDELVTGKPEGVWQQTPPLQTNSNG